MLLILLYMPHCDLSLHEEVFRYNWNANHLEGLFMITNDLNAYRERQAPHHLFLLYLNFIPNRIKSLWGCHWLDGLEYCASEKTQHTPNAHIPLTHPFM